MLSKTQYKWSSGCDISTCLKTIDPCYCVLCLLSLSLYCDVIWLFNPNKSLNLKSRLPGIMSRKWTTKQVLLGAYVSLMNFQFWLRLQMSHWSYRLGFSKPHYLTYHCGFPFERNCILYILRTLTHIIFILETMTWTRIFLSLHCTAHLSCVSEKQWHSNRQQFDWLPFCGWKEAVYQMEPKGATQPSQTC